MLENILEICKTIIMNFKYSVITDNSEAARKWLEMLGYVPLMWDEYDNKQPYIATMGDNEFCSVTHEDLHNNMCSVRVNCIGNPQLFQAVSAIREGTDFGQIFIDDNSTIIRCMRSDISIFSEYINPRKLSLEELQERFKEKEV